MKWFKKTIFSCCVVLSVTGCYAPQSKNNAYSQLPTDRLTISHGKLAADALANQAKSSLGQGATIIVSSFVNVDDITKSSALGRMLSQQFSSQFVHNDFNVMELLLRKNIYISENNNGEFMLSRDVKELSSQYQASAIIVGTYAAGANTVFVTAKVVDITTSRILSAVDFSIPLDNNVYNMLK